MSLMPLGMHRLKIITVLLGCLLLSCTSEPVQTDLLLPVDFSNVPASMMLTNFHTDKIEVKIEAPVHLIEQIHGENIGYAVDLYTDLEFDPAGASDSIEPGAYLIPVEKRRIPIHPDISIVSIRPSYLSVQLEKKLEKTFTIRVPYEGKPAKGYIALAPIVKPSSVTLSGAASFILSMKELHTTPIDLAGIKKTFKKELPLDLDTPLLVSSGRRTIFVEVPIHHKLVSKTIEKIPVQLYNCPYTATIEPSTITIEVKGPFETLGNKDMMDQIYSFVDIGDLKPGVYARHVMINVPVDLMMTRALPQIFTITVTDRLDSSS